MSTQTKIAALLKERIGFDVATVGRSVIERALRDRMAACGTKKLEDYWEKLQRGEAEMQALIEAIVVPETWFFRDREAFSALTNFVLKEWLPAHPTGVLRLLSVPCSSGEEPYSIAMALLDAGLTPASFRIDAADISARVLTLAREAVYTRNSFRGQDLDFRDSYFQRIGERYQLEPAVRAQVRFEQRNLLAEPLIRAQPYDVIFCRNVLIYFDAPTQERAIAGLRRLLAPDGLLLVGPSEAFVVRGNGFVSEIHARAFAYRKAPASGVAPICGNERPRKKARAIVPRPAPNLFAPKKPERSRTPVAAKPRADLKVARGLADAGDLLGAARACETYLLEEGGCAAGYYLLGIVHDALGDRTRAADCYRKTLYLQPDHGEALTHLSLLAQKGGDVASANRLHLRAQRAESSSSSSSSPSSSIVTTMNGARTKDEDDFRS